MLGISKRIGLLLLFLATAHSVSAQELTYSSSTHATLQEAVDQLESSGDVSHLLILPVGDYQERVSISSNMTLRGEETFGTRWSISDLEFTPLIQISGNVFVDVERITFLNGNIGIGLNDVSQANIHNNVFAMGSSNIAILSSDSSAANIYHNSFHETGVGFLGTQISGIVNNLFYSSGNSILGLSSDNLITSNHFESEPTGNRLGSDNTTGSIEFVSSTNLDLHLQSTSPAINSGNLIDGNDALNNNTPDLGAYGGNRMDLTPSPVTGVTITSSSNLASDVDVALNFNTYLDYQVDGFLLHFDTDEDGEPYSGNITGLGLSPLSLGNIQTSSLDNLDLSSVVATANLLSLTPRNNSLIAAWDNIDIATGYELRYRISGSSDSYESLVTGITTEATIPALSNGTLYEVELRALYQPTLYVAVSAFYGSGNNEAQRSRFSSSSTSFTVPEVLEGSYSTLLTGTPEETLPYPLLPNNGGGCLLRK